MAPFCSRSTLAHLAHLGSLEVVAELAQASPAHLAQRGLPPLVSCSVPVRRVTTGRHIRQHCWMECAQGGCADRPSPARPTRAPTASRAPTTSAGTWANYLEASSLTGFCNSLPQTLLGNISCACASGALQDKAAARSPPGSITYPLSAPSGPGPTMGRACQPA